MLFFFINFEIYFSEIEEYSSKIYHKYCGEKYHGLEIIPKILTILITLPLNVCIERYIFKKLIDKDKNFGSIFSFRIAENQIVYFIFFTYTYDIVYKAFRYMFGR